MEAKHSQDVMDEDIANWLRSVPAKDFENPYFHLSELVKQTTGSAPQDAPYMLNAWDCLRIAYNEAFGQTDKEKPKDYIGDYTVRDFLQRSSVDELSALILGVIRDYEDTESIGVPKTAWEAIRWLMADRHANALFCEAAKSHEHLKPERMQ
jgi:hypothetical protein